MPPNSEEPAHPQTHGSFPHLKYPTYRDHRYQIGDKWLEAKRIDDNCDGLWRIHDDLYDLTSFMKRHPGGSVWLEMTQGTDITEAFETHHIMGNVEKMLPKFHVRKATSPRYSPYTFHDDGFYRTLKRRVREVYRTVPRSGYRNSKLMIDSLLVGYLVTAIIAAVIDNFCLAVFSGNLLCGVVIAAHNFFHQKDNFRMYYFDLSAMSSREWRISHVLSHHLFTNTLLDLEITMFEPVFMYLPRTKNFREKYLTWLYTPIVYVLFFPFSCIMTKIVRIFALKSASHIHWSDFVFLLPPLLMYFVTGLSLYIVLKIWTITYLTSSFIFALIGLNAAHHHPDIFHDGDQPREDRDWGLGQLDAVVDRKEIQGNHFFVLTTFGDHGLHHMFPTLDHGTLSYFYPIFEEVCREFGVELRTNSIPGLMIGQFKQLARDKPNSVPPTAKKE